MVMDREAIVQKWVSRQTLTPEQIEEEKRLRPQLLAALSDYRAARFKMGALLVEYRRHFKGIYQSLYDALGITKMTALNLLKDFDRASKVLEPVREAALNRGYDVAEKKHEALGVALAKIKATDDVEINEAVEDAVTAYLNAKKATKKAPVEPDAELSEDYVQDHDVKPKSPVKMKDRLDRNIENALEEMSRDELADAIADLVKSKQLKKAA